MKQHILLFCTLAGLLLACQPDKAPQEQEEAQATATSQVEEKEESPTPMASPNRTQRPKKDDKPELGQRKPYQPPKAGAELQLSFPDQKAQAGAEVCLPLRAKGFKDLLSNQYTIKWDAKVLAYKELKDFKLPGLGMQNFGTNRTDQGIMPSVWIDNSLRGVSMPDDGPLYTICFKVVGQSGQSSTVSLVDQPTAFEVVNVQEKIVDLSPGVGTVTVE
jgi:hypothetical protein